MSLETNAWCNGKIHLLSFPKDYRGTPANFTLNKKLSKKSKTSIVFQKKCDSTCHIFLEYGVDECGCFFNPDLEIK